MTVADTPIDNVVRMADAVEARVCKTCGKAKPVASFEPVTPDRRRTSCRACRRKTPKGRASVLAQRSRQYIRSRASPHKRLLACVAAAKQRATKSGVKFALDADWIAAAAQVTHCPVTGLAFDYSKSATFKNPLAPSIDRLNNSEGYTPENSRLICSWANTAKNDLSDEQFRALIFSTVAHSFGANTQALYGSGPKSR